MRGLVGAPGQPPQQHLNYPGLNFANMSTAMINAAYGAAAAAQTMQNRNIFGSGPYQNSSVVATSAGTHSAAASLYNSQFQMQSAPATSRQVATHPDLKLSNLPFYDVKAELLKPVTLVANSANRFQEAHYQFLLTGSQATDVASNRDISPGSKLEYPFQIQLRFGQLSIEPGAEVSDEFPPNVCLHVNGKPVTLPNPIPTNKPGAEPKRPPKPVNISFVSKLSPIATNNISVKWATEYGKCWVVGVWLVKKMSSADLLERLKKKGTRDAAYTRKLIQEKLNDDDEVETTSVTVSLACPLGKMRMLIPCRPSTCTHLQCFDASLFIQMNERKPTWNCPVCDKKALYDTLLVDGYFTEVLASPNLPKEENEIILERDGSWNPTNMATDSSVAATAANSNGAEPDESEEENSISVHCINLSDDEQDEIPLPGPPPLPTYLPPLPATVQPPPPPDDIECIALD